MVLIQVKDLQRTNHRLIGSWIRLCVFRKCFGSLGFLPQFLQYKGPLHTSLQKLLTEGFLLPRRWCLLEVFYVNLNRFSTSRIRTCNLVAPEYSFISLAKLLVHNAIDKRVYNTVCTSNDKSESYKAKFFGLQIKSV